MGGVDVMSHSVQVITSAEHKADFLLISGVCQDRKSLDLLGVMGYINVVRGIYGATGWTTRWS